MQREAAEYLLLLDTGDALVTGDPMDGQQTPQPGQALLAYHPLGDRTRGAAIVAGMNLMGYDAMALGPKDLTLGLDVLRQRLAEAEFSMLSANVVLADSGDLLAPAYTVVQAGPHRLGVLGLTRPSPGPLPGLEIGDPQVALAQWLPEVAARADVVILLTNLEFRSAMNLAAAVPGLDLLVAALPGQLPSGALQVPETGTVAVTAEQAMARHSGRRVGELVLVLRDDASLAVQSWQSVEMSRLIADDLAMAALLQSYR